MVALFNWDRKDIGVTFREGNKKRGSTLCIRVSRIGKLGTPLTILMQVTAGEGSHIVKELKPDERETEILIPAGAERLDFRIIR